MKAKQKKQKKTSRAGIWLLVFGMIFCLPAMSRAGEVSNEAFLKEMVKSNWLQLERKVPVLKKVPFAILAQDSTSLIGRLVATLFRDVAFSESTRPVFIRKRGERAGSEWTVFTWVTKFGLDFTPVSSGWFGKKKWERNGLLENRFEITDQTGKIIWEGTLKAAHRDTLDSREFADARNTSPVFLKGRIVEKRSTLFKTVRLALLLGISAAVVGLFYSIRTS